MHRHLIREMLTHYSVGASRSELSHTAIGHPNAAKNIMLGTYIKETSWMIIYAGDARCLVESGIDRYHSKGMN